jgi:hypothetical protein
MAEIVEEAFANGHAWLGILAILFMGLASYFGVAKFKTEKNAYGKNERDNEQMIMRKQLDYAEAACVAFEKKIPRFKDYDEKLGEVIALKAYAEISKWVASNHIETSENYLKTKREIIWNIIVAETVRDEMRSDKFKRKVDENIEQIITALVQIREDNNTEG